MNKTVATMILSIAAVLTVLMPGCAAQSTPAPTSTVTLSQYQLGYRLLAAYPDFFWCDPDFYPIGREGGEEQNALAQFPTIRANVSEFSAILTHLNLQDKANYTDSEKLSLYREHKKLTVGIQMTSYGSGFNYSLRIKEGQGEHIEGTITEAGKITVTLREPGFNTYPICLTRGTHISTPSGEIPVEQLRTGMTVWTTDASGQRVVAAVKKVSATPVPETFPVVRLTLSDGRSVTASPGHPSADSRALGEYRVGDMLDGAIVVSVESVEYDGGATFDLLPSGPTGTYRANGVLLKSTLPGS